jgi:hypothetical protein
VPSEVALGVDAVGPYLGTASALQSSSAAIGSALSSVRQVAAVNALPHTPVNAVKAFLQSEETDSGQSSAGVNVPVAGLLGSAADNSEIHE